MNKNDLEVIDLLKKGERRGFDLLYQSYAQDLYRHLNKMVGKEAIAEELCHDSLITITQKISFYTPKKHLKNSFKAWCFRIATNKAIDHIRSLKQLNRLNKENFIPEVSEEGSNLDIEGFINQLPILQKTFISLKIHEGFNYKEIAAICECTENSVKQGIFRAKKLLKDLMKEEGFVL